MEKTRFNFLVVNYTSLTQDETADLRVLQDHYGYCQVLHNLIARGDQDVQSDLKDHSLNVAAVYSTDRAILKKIMTDARVSRIDTPVLVSAPTPEPIQVMQPVSVVEVAAVKIEPKKEVINTAPATPVSLSDFDSDAALSRFMAELAPMHEKKLQFEKAIEELNSQLNSPQPEKKTSTRPKPPGRKPKPKPEVTAEIEVSVTLESESPSTENILSEIKSSKKKVAPTSTKQKEQTEIIDQFIKASPSISKPTSEPKALDLTEITESYNENVVSETLAAILIRQGKKDKAIEVLRKLIWKFPQKKAYFTAQIEDLTK